MRRPTPLSRRTGAAVLACAAVMALAGCSSVTDLFTGGSEPERDEAGDIVSAAEADAFSLRVGDCLNSADLAELVTTVPVIPCDEPHDSEIYAQFLFDDGDFPGDDIVAKRADDFCYGEFPEFVGLAWEESSLQYFPLSPTADTWDQLNDREVLCLVVDEENPVTGTLAGAGR